MKIIKSCVLLCLLVCSVNLSAQLSILFVDDTDDTFGNAETFFEAIENAGYAPVYFDAVLENAGPTLNTMEGYDLVVWHTSTDGFGLHLWEAQDQDNPELTAYLETGGNLWLVGLDFLFDRYDVPPSNFTSGEFVYDFLGIESYDVQSYGDDGEIGVPFVSPVDQAPINGLENIAWTFETLWWVDGVTNRSEAFPIYQMDGTGYPLSGEISGLYHSGDGFNSLTYLFDLALASPADLANNVSAVLGYFDELTLGLEDVAETEEIQIYPNPVKRTFEISADKNLTIQSILIRNISGEEIINFPEAQESYFIFDLLPGVYFLVIETDQGKFQKKLLKI